MTMKLNCDVLLRCVPWLAVGVSFVSSLGCESTKRGLQVGTESAKELVSQLDITRTTATRKAQMDMLTVARERIETIDVAGFNRMVQSLGDVVTGLQERIDAVQPADLARLGEDASAAVSALRTQAEEAEFNRTLKSIRELADALHAQASAVDPEQLSTVLDQTAEVLHELRDAIAALDVHLDSTFAETESLLGQAVDSMHSLPTAELRRAIEEAERTSLSLGQAAANVPETIENLQRVLGTIRVAFGVVMIAAGLVGACACVWLVGQRRSRGGIPAR